ncbi:MAG: hypothetical protein LBG60_01250 [Bifidobacteriaceae bacterium]|jgi:tRNA/tmRNA/rRNA uracil-C5-methylase (TrmA/RlmC/RlmD family)|nr:hypothetical protein [Bifidobacteriaceae bacterium]
MIELTAGPWGNGGVCACRQADGPVVLVSGAIPGERVLAQVTRRTRSYWLARVAAVLEPSPDRVEPAWPEGAALGAADWLHLAPAAARAAKGEVAVGLLRHALGSDADGAGPGVGAGVGARGLGDGADPPLGVPLEVEALGDGAALGWRTKSELAVDDAGRAGMFQTGSHRFEALAAMPLATPEIQALGLFDRSWPAGARLTALAPSAGPAFWVFGGARTSRRRREAVTAAGRTHHYELDARGFWQIHRLGPQTLAEAVLAVLQPAPGQVVWDLYAGAGLFTLPLAAAGARVAAVEGSRQAAKDLRANARRSGLELLGVETQAVAKALRAGLPGPGPDAALLDPPRAGAGRAVIEAVAAARPARVAYLACEPAALARDLRLLAAGGYALTALRAFDLFPGTHHIEILALAERA